MEGGGASRGGGVAFGFGRAPGARSGAIGASGAFGPQMIDCESGPRRRTSAVRGGGSPFS